MGQSTSTITTAIWQEQPHPTNDQICAEARCHGYDVFGQMLGKASLVDMLHLLLTGEAPTSSQAQILNHLAVAIANPGPRDPSVYAAMCGGIGGSTAASCLMAAMAAGAGRHGGAREVYDCMSLWANHAYDIAAIMAASTARDVDGVWPASAHAAGFNPVSAETPPVVLRTLEVLVQVADGTESPLAWLLNNRATLEGHVGAGLSMPFVAAMAFVTLGLTAEQGEMAYLFLRLPGAAVHALEQSNKRYSEFPFPSIEFVQKGQA